MPVQPKSDGWPTTCGNHWQVGTTAQRCDDDEYLLLVNKGLFQQNTANALFHGVFLGFGNSFLLWWRQLGWREQSLLTNSALSADDYSHLWRLRWVWFYLGFDTGRVGHVLGCRWKRNLLGRAHVHSMINVHLHVPVTHCWKSHVTMLQWRFLTTRVSGYRQSKVSEKCNKQHATLVCQSYTISQSQFKVSTQRTQTISL